MRRSNDTGRGRVKKGDGAMHSIGLRIRLFFEMVAHGAIIATITVLAVYRMDAILALPRWLTISAGCVLLIVLVFANLLYTTNLSCLLCRQAAAATLIDDVPVFIGSEGSTFRDSFMDLVEIEYVHHGRRYRRHVLCPDNMSLSTGGPVSIAVCRWWPRIVCIKGQAA